MILIVRIPPKHLGCKNFLDGVSREVGDLTGENMTIKESIPLPQKEDKLFKSDVDWKNNACLNFSHDMWEGYISGYRLAGDIAVEHVKNEGRDQDFLVYPIVFLYRQYLELRLKDIIKNGYQLFDLNESFSQNYNVGQLWKSAREIMERAWPNEATKELDAIESCVNEFCRIDPTSTSFRYPQDKKGKRALEGLTHINLRNLAEIINKLADFLDGAAWGISEYLSSKYENMFSV